MQTFDTVITWEYLISNISHIKAVNVLIKLIAFSSDHYELVRYEGSPLGRIRFFNKNAFILYSFKELSPREQKMVMARFYLKRRIRLDANTLLDTDISGISLKMRKKVINYAYTYASRRVKKVAERIKRKTSNLLEVEWEILDFLKRNIKCNESLESDPETIFFRNYGGLKDLVFAFNIINMLIGIPARTTSGFLLRDNELKRYVWSEIFTGRDWIPVNPCIGVLLDPNDPLLIPIKVESYRSIREIESQYKLVRQVMKKAIAVFRYSVNVIVKTNKGVYSGQLESIAL